jgi:3,4-dihydroxy 2-butanone 4-phosphate synthase/GTP cyclohydrolase II
MSETALDPIEDVIAAIGRGEIVVIVDDEDRENEGDFIMAAEFATPEKLAFIVRYSTGVICAPLTDER